MKLRQRLAGIAMAVSLLVSGLTLADSPVKPVESAAAYGCGTQGVYHAGGDLDTYNFTTVRGIKAELSSATKLDLCDGVSGTIDNASAWIAVVPDVGTPYASNTNAIMQAGFYIDVFTGGVRMFYAIGGCPGHLPIAEMFAGAGGFTPGGWVDFQITRASGGVWTLRATIESTGQSYAYALSSSDNRISCWAYDNVKGQLSGEMKNSFGTVGYPDSHFYFRNVKFQVSSGGTWWYPTQKTSTGVQMGINIFCDFVSNVPDDRGYDNDFHCDAPGTIGDKLDIWTTHVPL